MESQKSRSYNVNVNTGSSTESMRIEYSIRDHLGNTRLTFTDKNSDGKIDVTTTSTNEILSEQHYYPFGLSYGGNLWMNDAADVDNRYQYNGKEFNAEHGLGWYNYGARWYDATIGRWNAVDPLAAGMSCWSPYNYVFNNPLKFTDPTGMAPFTDYYNQKGQHVKHVDDGSDAKVMVMTTSKKAADVDAAIANGQTGPVASNSALAQMNAAYDATENNGNERGFAVATDGTTSSMAEGETGNVNVIPTRNELVVNGKTVAYDVHTHPEGNAANEVGSPMPSDADVRGAATTDPQNSVILGYTRTVTTTTKSITSGNEPNTTTTTTTTRTIGFYNNRGSTGTMNYRKYQRAVQKINKEG